MGPFNGQGPPTVLKFPLTGKEKDHSKAHHSTQSSMQGSNCRQKQLSHNCLSSLSDDLISLLV